MKYGILGALAIGGFAVGAIKIHDMGRVTFHNPLRKEHYDSHLRERGEALSLDNAAVLRNMADGALYSCTVLYQNQPMTLDYVPQSHHWFTITIPKGNRTIKYHADQFGFGESYSECLPQTFQDTCFVYFALNSVAQIQYLSGDPPSETAYQDIRRQRELTALLLEFAESCARQ